MVLLESVHEDRVLLGNNDCEYEVSVLFADSLGDKLPRLEREGGEVSLVCNRYQVEVLLDGGEAKSISIHFDE